MAEGKLLKAWGAGCGWQLIVILLISFVLLGGLACLAVVVTLAPVSEGTRQALGLGGFIMLVLGLIGGASIWAVITIRKRANQLDAAFLPLGLSGQGYLTSGRQYHGLVRGRQVDVYFYRGPTMDIHVAAPLRTRIGIGTKSSLSRMATSIVKRDPLDTGDPDLAKLAIYPNDPQWCSELLADSQAKRILPRLMAEEGPFEIRNLIIQPEALQLKLYRLQVRQITPEAVQHWINDMLELVQVAENLPAPSKLETASALEQRSRLNRSSFIRPAVLITLGIIGAMTLCGIIVAMALIWLGESGY